MKRYNALAALLAAAALTAACGREDDGSPTATENESLNNISEELDTIVQQSEASDRIVREMEALLRSDGADWTAAAAAPAVDVPPVKVPPIPVPPRQKVKGR